MTVDHQRAQEMLAGHALHALTDSERAEADRLLARHVPGCEQCRMAQESFALVAEDLAIAPRPVEPPALVPNRLRRASRARRKSLRREQMTAAVVALALVGGLAAWNTHLAAQVARAEHARALEGEVIATVTQPESQVIPLTASGSAMAGSRVVATWVPGKGHLYLFGSLPDLPHHRVYHVWLKRGSTYHNGGTFEPDAGHVYVRVEADPNKVDAVVVTQEPAGTTQNAPPPGQGSLTGNL
jgi:Anti-sigma-K factor rskA, C-terminal